MRAVGSTPGFMGSHLAALKAGCPLVVYGASSSRGRHHVGPPGQGARGSATTRARLAAAGPRPATSWLEVVRAALDASRGPCPIFFRDDDAGLADERLLALLDVFEARGVEIDVAVIPAALHEPLVGSLLARATCAGVRLHQHGYAHGNHEATGREFEFGPSRDLPTQTRDIANGQRLLREAFGELLDPVFTPPWNRSTSDTGAAVVDAGMRIISQDQEAHRHDRAGLVEIPITVDWFARHRGVRLSLDEVAGAIASGIRAGGPVGLLLHHAASEEEDRVAIDSLLALLVGHPSAATTTILQLAC